MKRLVVLAGLAAVGLCAGACSNSTTGQPTWSTTANSGGQGTSDTQPDTTTSSSGGGFLPVDQPCSLLSSTDLSTLGVNQQPASDMVGTAHACDLDNPQAHIIVAIRTDVGLAGFQASGGSVRSIKVGSHDAKQVLDNTGSCLIGIGVSDSSRVDITATGDGTTSPCPTASKVANMIEPELP